MAVGVICVVYNGTIINGGQLSVAGGAAGAGQSNRINVGTNGSEGTTLISTFSDLENNT